MEGNRFERSGNFYHSFDNVMVTAGSRLFLAMAESKVKELCSTQAYMDTNSIFFSPKIAITIIQPSINLQFQHNPPKTRYIILLY